MIPMKPSLLQQFAPSRRDFLKTILAAGMAPMVVPAHVLGADAPSGKISVGVIGVGAQGTSDMHAFLKEKSARVTAICDINKRNLANAQKAIAQSYGPGPVKEYTDFRELNAAIGCGFLARIRILIDHLRG